MPRFAPPPEFLVRTIGNETFHKILLGVTLLSQVTIGMILGPIGNDLIRLQVRSAFYPETYRQQITAWSLEERARFEKHYDLDYVFHPFAYGSLFASWVTVETNKLGYSPLPYWLMALMPIVAGLCDVMENSIQAKYARNPEELSMDLSRRAGIFALIKWILILPILIWCVYRFIMRIFVEKGEKVKYS